MEFISITLLDGFDKCKKFIDEEVDILNLPQTCSPIKTGGIKSNEFMTQSSSSAKSLK